MLFDADQEETLGDTDEAGESLTGAPAEIGGSHTSSNTCTQLLQIPPGCDVFGGNHSRLSSSLLCTNFCFVPMKGSRSRSFLTAGVPGPLWEAEFVGLRRCKK